MIIKMIKWKKCRKKYEEWRDISDSTMCMVKKYTTENNYELATEYIRAHAIAFNKSLDYLKQCQKIDL